MNLINDCSCNDSQNICLISKEPIENKITLNKCNHSFEYYYLYQEIIQQKKRKYRLENEARSEVMNNMILTSSCASEPTNASPRFLK